jgi:octaprenyl-diphosphate synthase
MVILGRHDAISASEADAVQWANRAKASLRNLPVHPIREILSEIADYVVSRMT